MQNFKLNTAAAGVALALSGTANASLPVDVEVFMSGASAPSNMLRENVVQFGCDKNKTINVYADFVDQAPGNGNPAQAEPILEHRSFWAVQCTANSSLGTAAGKTIAFYKSDVGGSGNGTTPVLNRVPVQFMDANPTNCSLVTAGQAGGNGTTYNLYACDQNDLVNQIPDMGAADIEASKFVGQLAPASGDFINDGSVQEKVGPGLVFGVVVTKSMRDELQADQISAGLLPSSCSTSGQESELCMPSLPSTVARSLTSGKYNNWSDISVYGKVPNVPSSFGDPKKNNVHLCRRVQGSGTHAEYLIHYHRTNCYTAAQPILSQPGSGATGFGIGPLVYENSSSGTLGSCLDALDTGVGLSSPKITPDITSGTQSFGIGYQSTEKNMDLAKNYRFVKIDGIAPTVDNAIKGDYRQVYYSGFQNRTSGYNTGPLRSTINSTKTTAIKDIFNNGTNINASIVAVLDQGFVHNWGQGGFIVPDATAPAKYTPGSPKTPWTREKANGAADSCQPLFKKK